MPIVAATNHNGAPFSGLNLASELRSKFIKNSRFVKGTLVESKKPNNDIIKEPIKELATKQYAQTTIKFYPNLSNGMGPIK